MSAITARVFASSGNPVIDPLETKGFMNGVAIGTVVGGVGGVVLGMYKSLEHATRIGATQHELAGIMATRGATWALGSMFAGAAVAGGIGLLVGHVQDEAQYY